MINKKLTVAVLCVGLTSSVVWCNMQVLVTPRVLKHIAGAVSGAGIAAFFGSPFFMVIIRKNHKAFMETYFIKIIETLKEKKVITISPWPLVVGVVGCVGGLGLLGYMGNEVRRDFQHREEVSAK